MKKNKNYIIFVAIILALLLALLLAFIIRMNFNNTKNIDFPKLEFRVFYDNNKWSFWTKNGSIKGKTNSKKYLKNIEIRNNFSDQIGIEFYKDGSWIEKEDFKSDYITGIRISVFQKFASSYSICYRTYNDSDGWMGWSCNGENNGNKLKKIKSVQIKLIPKRAIKSEYLNDYDDNKKTQKNFE